MFDTLSDITNTNWFYSAFAIIALASTVVTIIVIVSENRNPVKSLAWVTVLLLLPIVGLILYIFFGRNIKNTRMISRRARRKLRRREPRWESDLRDISLSSSSKQLINLGRSLIGSPFYADNSVEVFTNGEAKFKSLEDDIRAARKSINMQYYIFEDDNLGCRIANLLIEKARQGVTVRIMYDHVGSFNVRSSFFRKLRDAGIDASPFFRVTFPQLATRINWRNHRKICIIDNAIGYIGGMNIADRYIDGGKSFDHWRDTHIRLTGSAIAALHYSFAVDWNFMCGEVIEDDGAEILPSVIGRNAITGIGAQLLTSGPTSQWANIALAYNKAIANAQRRVYIQTPYFLPTEGLLKALQAAALSHVDVRIMMPEYSDSYMLTHASASYIAECLRAGIKFYRYKGGMLHSKLLIIDDEIVSVGSTNFDFRSFECNFESNLFLYSKPFANRMLEIFKNDQQSCVRIKPAEWRRRPLPRKIAESILRLLSPVL